MSTIWMKMHHIFRILTSFVYHVKSAITFSKVRTLMTIQVVLSMEVRREKNQQFCGSRKIEEEQSWRCGVETEARTMG